jgi:xanthine dehydrogenase accessory factor
MSWPRRALEEIARQGPLVRVTVIRAEGSTPREIGAAMLVGAGGITDTIGGGALEFQAIAHARGILAEAAEAPPWRRDTRDFALGPSLGQCCGGFVRLLFELFTDRERPLLENLAHAAYPERRVVLRPLDSGIPPRAVLPESDGDPWPAAAVRALRGRPSVAALIPGRKGEPDWLLEPLAAPAAPLVLYGAGHVGRALVRVLEGLPFALTWVDTDAARFPADVPAQIAARISTDPAALAGEAPPGALHIVMTYSHPLDLAICHAVLKQDAFRFLGLIGSETKRTRFAKRLRELGIAEEQLSRLICPIGLAEVEGKQPAIIAVAIAAQLLSLPQKATP